MSRSARPFHEAEPLDCSDRVGLTEPTSPDSSALDVARYVATLWGRASADIPAWPQRAADWLTADLAQTFLTARPFPPKVRTCATVIGAVEMQKHPHVTVAVTLERTALTGDTPNPEPTIRVIEMTLVRSETKCWLVASLAVLP